MNILMICDEYPPGRHGGIGSVVQLIARTFVKMGHNVTVAGFYFWAYGGEDEFIDEGVKVYRFRRNLSSTFFEPYDTFTVRAALKLLDVTGMLEWDIKNSMKKYSAFLNNQIAEHNIDIVEMPDYHDYMRFCKDEVHFPKLNVPIVVKMNGSMTYFSNEAGNKVPEQILNMEKAVLEQADRVVAVSKYTADKSAQYFKYPHEIGVVHNGINIPEIAENVTKTKGLVVFSGTLVEKKGIYQLMKAWNIVADKIPTARLYIYGKGPVQKIQTLLNDNAKKTVDFKGHVGRDELYRILSSAEIAVFPSYAECFAMAPMEAMACNTAVLYSTRTSGPELIHSGIDGYLADPDDFQDIADKLILLLQDEQLNAEIARKGKSRVVDNFDIKIIAKQNIELFKSVLNQYADSQQ